MTDTIVLTEAQVNLIVAQTIIRNAQRDELVSYLLDCAKWCQHKAVEYARRNDMVNYWRWINGSDEWRKEARGWRQLDNTAFDAMYEVAKSAEWYTLK